MYLFNADLLNSLKIALIETRVNGPKALHLTNAHGVSTNS